MATMFNAVGNAPGVYIQEINVPGPIAGVATSTAAFVGPARRGDSFTPTFLTNWSQFVNAFGVADPSDPYGPYLPDATVYVTHAVRGFFDNGGTHCYFVRVGTAVRASLGLDDREGTPQKSVLVRAKKDGKAGNEIKVEVKDASLVSTGKVARSAAAVDVTTAAAGGTVAVLKNEADAQTFRPGDAAHFEKGGDKEDVAITGVNVTTKTLTLAKPLAKDYAGGKARIGDLQKDQTRIRLVDLTGIEPGSYVTLKNGAANESAKVVNVVPASSTIVLATGLKNAYALDADVDVTTTEFTLLITPAPPASGPAPAVETYANLSMEPSHSRYFATVIDSPTVDVVPPAQPITAPAPQNVPKVAAAAKLTNGDDDNLGAIQPKHFKDGIDTLKLKTDVNLLCVPDRTDEDVQSYMVQHCEAMQDRFAILDPRRNAGPFTELPAQREKVTSLSGYAALYYPWISISNPTAPGQLLVPPSGHIAGVYARVDDSRGVHKAPANESIRGALALERELTDADQGTLNDKGINVIRRFPEIGILIWGARTTAPANRTQWRYLNVRRLVIYLEKSIQLGTQFAVFEPNDLALRKRIERMVGEFLTRVWRSGALFGATAAEAFRVRADEELNPPDVRALGQLIVEVVVVPTVPAEFVVFQIVQDPTGASLTEQ